MGCPASCSSSSGGGGGGNSSIMLVSWNGVEGDRGAGFWKKTSSKSCNMPVSSGRSWSIELMTLDSEIRSEDRCWRMDGWEDAEGDGTKLPLYFLFVGDESNLVFSAECPPLTSKLKVSFAVSCLCTVCLRATRVSL